MKCASALLNGKALVENVAFDVRWPLQRDAQTFDRSEQAAANNDFLGHHLVSYVKAFRLPCCGAQLATCQLRQQLNQ